MPSELRHAHSTVEIRDGTDDGCSFCLGLRELNRILQFILRNINSSFDIPILAINGIPIRPS